MSNSTPAVYWRDKGWSAFVHADHGIDPGSLLGQYTYRQVC